MAGEIKSYPTTKSGPDTATQITSTGLGGDKSALDVAVKELIGEISGTFTPGGLQNGGKHTVVAIDSTSWTALPTTALTDRNQINIQNFSGVEIKINADNGVGGYVGMRVPDQTERFYQITDAIILYAKSQAGSVNIDVEELA